MDAANGMQDTEFQLYDASQTEVHCKVWAIYCLGLSAIMTYYFLAPYSIKFHHYVAEIRDSCFVFGEAESSFTFRFPTTTLRCNHTGLNF